MRLICLPHAGAGTGVYRPWTSVLAPDITVIAPQLPGRDGLRDRPAFTRLTALVDWLASRVLEPLAAGPYALFGHSVGALAAFELAREARRRGWPAPVRLFVSGRPAPDAERVSRAIHQLPDAEFRAEIAALGGTPAPVLAEPSLMDLLVPTLRADFAVAESYEWSAEAPLDIPITVFGGDADRHAPVPALERWRAHTTGACAVRVLPGGHFFVTSARDAMLAHIARDLEAHAPSRDADLLEHV